MATDIYAQAVRSFPALAGLPAGLRVRFAAEARLITAPAGATVFEPGSPCGTFPIVLAGTIRVARLAGDGREIVLYRVLAGEPCVVTTNCLIRGSDYIARGAVETPLTAIAVGRSLFAALLDGHPPFRDALMTHFADRMVSLMALVGEVAFDRLDVRLAALLVTRGPQVRATHQALAEDLGSVREAVSRTLKLFEARGWVALGRQRIDVLDGDGLRRFARRGRDGPDAGL
jgi:CRP/FNR family transcriptional regulator